MTRKVLVTGGAGYVGYHVVRQLIEKGYQVTVLDNLAFGRDSLGGFSNNPSFELIQGDIRHVEDLVTAMKGAQGVIHLAAIVGDSACELNPEATRTVNYEATKVLMEVCKYYGVEKLVFASTCSVYGAGSNIILNEGSLLNPVSLYAETRVQSEKVVLNTCGNTTTPVVLRLATIYGLSRRMRFDLVVNILTAKATMEHKIKIYGGKQWRPVVHVEDAASAFVLSLEAPREKVDHETFNVGSNGQNYRILELGQLIQEYIPGSEAEYMPEEKDERDYRVSFDKITHILGFQSRRTLRDGVLEIKKALTEGVIRDFKESKYYNINYRYR